MTRLRKITCCAALCAPLLTDSLFAGERCLSYEPAKVELSGKLLRKTFPGPPNYESIEQGDRAETGYYLQLKTGICTRAREDEEAGDHDNVKELQLVLTEQLYDALRPQLGKQVSLQGTLFEAHTGHHHTPVLMNVNKRR